MTETALKVN